MGIKDFLARASGPSGFGRTFGRSTVENGSELGRTLYLGHGIDKSAARSGSRLFDDAAQMRAAGFELYCPDPATKPPAEDLSVLSIHCRAIGMAFATHLALSCARFFKSGENKSAFNRAAGQGTRDRLIELNRGVTVEIFKQYTYMKLPELELLNQEAPGQDDLLGFYLSELAKTLPTYSVGFQRTGALGFAAPSVSLMNQTVTGFESALSKFRW